MKAEIISIGTEILLGEITDTNAAYLAGELASLGIELCWVSQVGDSLEKLVEVLDRAWNRSDIVLTTGGLGPTGDDLTREAIAVLFNETAEIDPALEKNLRDRFKGFGIDMSQNNLKQVTIIPSAKPVINTQGTAPGWWVKRDGKQLIAMPGPPRELYVMWQERVKPELIASSGSVILTRTIKTFGLPEGTVGEMVQSLLEIANPVLGIYAKLDGIHLRLAANAADELTARQLIAQGEREIEKLLIERIWGYDEDTLESVVGNLLIKRGLTLAVMEDYSGGWLISSITDISNHDKFFKGGLVATSRETKEIFGVDRNIVDDFGLASPETAIEMAEAVRRILRADIGIGTTALEESNGSGSKAFIGISGPGIKRVVSRPRRKQQVSATAMFELRKAIKDDVR